jgi:hypothetical protein
MRPNGRAAERPLLFSSYNRNKASAKRCAPTRIAKRKTLFPGKGRGSEFFAPAGHSIRPLDSGCGSIRRPQKSKPTNF